MAEKLRRPWKSHSDYHMILAFHMDQPNTWAYYMHGCETGIYDFKYYQSNYDSENTHYSQHFPWNQINGSHSFSHICWYSLWFLDLCFPHISYLLIPCHSDPLAYWNCLLKLWGLFPFELKRSALNQHGFSENSQLDKSRIWKSRWWKFPSVDNGNRTRSRW